MVVIDSPLISQLNNAVTGAVRSAELDRYLYSTDASLYRVMPSVVVTPRTADDICQTVRIAGEYGVSIVPRGGGTSLSGQTVGEGIVIDLSQHFNDVLEFNPERCWVRVQAGMTLANLNRYVAQHGLKVGPDPASAPSATVGGMTGNNSTGVHSILYGMMADHVREVDVVLADGRHVTFGPKTPDEVAALQATDTLEGRLYRDIPQLIDAYREDIKERYPRTWRNVAGYNLQRMLKIIDSGESLNLAPLIVGSEGTLGVITAIKVNLVAVPKATVLCVVHFDALRESLELVPHILTHKPASVELMDDFYIRMTRSVPSFGRQLTFIEGDPAAVLTVEFYGDSADALLEQTTAFESSLREGGYTGHISYLRTPGAVSSLWNIRRASLGLIRSERKESKPLEFIEDVAVPVDQLADYVEDVRAVLERNGVAATFGAHASAGCLHISPNLNLKTVQGVEAVEAISQGVMEVVLRYNGTTSGEHGEGFARSYYNERLYGERLHQAFRQVKGLFDPNNMMNPGKIIDGPEPWDPSLMRINPSYGTPHAPNTTFLDFTADGGFAGLVEMCNGMGICRKTETGVMCPPYMVTRDEAHSTRGRANALRAAISGALGDDGLNHPAVYEVLDLCVECKACKSECPSMVDMAKLKYEFLAQVQQTKGVPMRSQIFGDIAVINSVLTRFRLRKLTNWAFSNPVVRDLMARVLHIDRRRSLPKFAAQPFRYTAQAQSTAGKRGKVLLWDDTFNSDYEPHILRAAVSLLEALGYHVAVAGNRRCCGRPMISKGLLSSAMRVADHNVRELLPYIRGGYAVVGLEPSCISAFKDEYPDLLRSDDAREVAQNSYFIEDYLAEQIHAGAISVEMFNPADEAVSVHPHCHQRALGGEAALMTVLQTVPGLRVSLIDGGCCGMAGSFGYEAEHYDLSMRMGEDRLFPAVSAATGRVVATGTSCRHQIHDGTGTRAVHSVEILAEYVKRDE